jgi:hypothetical protein
LDFASLKDQLKDQFKDLMDRIQESSLYIELRERFELLPSRAQKAIIFIAVLLTGLFMFSFPYGNLSTSWEYEDYYADNQGLIRDLLRASSTLKETSPLPSTGSAGAVEARVRQIIQELRLIPEQIGNIQVIPGANSKLATGVVNQEAISVQIQKLNLRQVTELSHRLQTLGAGIQPLSLQIQRSSGQTHYYDVILRVFQFSLNVASDDEKTPPRRRGR